MTTVVDRGSGSRSRPAATAPVPAPIGLLPRRRRWGLVAVGTLLVVVFAIVAYLLVATAATTRPVLALARNVPYGATLGADDLTVVDVNAATGLSPVPASQRDQVIGKHAAADLFAGTLLTKAQVADLVIPAPGQQLVGIELKPGQVPARPLRPGDQVMLVIVPPTALAGLPDSQTGAQSATTSIRATVAETTGAQTNGNIRVDVAVSTSDGPTVAAMAAAGRIVVVVSTRDK
jgi:hypothetical protein